MGLSSAVGRLVRMTVCNMSIEGGARAGYVNPDETNFEYIKDRPYAPKGDEWGKAVESWRAFSNGGRLKK